MLSRCIQNCLLQLSCMWGRVNINSHITKVSYHFIQAPHVLPVVKPREMDSCGDTVFPKTPWTCVDLQNIKPIGHEWKDLVISLDDAIELEKSTRLQCNDQLWHVERKKRLTASNFGLIIKRKKDVNIKFLKNTFDKKDFRSCATSYGKANELVAKQMYIKKTGNHIHDVGLVVNPEFPFLGATPDGIVCEASETGIIEVKCPYSVRDLTLTMACEKRGDFFLCKDGDSFSLSHDHAHWYQVQGQLLTTGAKFCDFVTFTKSDFHVERIYPHQSTMNDLIDRLSQFYVNHYKPFLTILENAKN